MSLDWLLEPWGSGLMRRAFAEAALTGAVCGALGCFVLVRGLAFLGESLAHTLLLGVVLAFLLGTPVGLAAAAVAALTVLLTERIAADRRFGDDVASGILLPGFFGLAVVLITSSEGFSGGLEGALFGTILGVTAADVALAASVGLVTVVVLVLAGKELVLASFDRPAAAAMGYPLRALDLLLLALVTAAAVIGLRAVGNVLFAALLLGPPAIARLACRSFWPMAGCAAAIGVAAGVAGLYVSWNWDVGGGPAIVLLITALFIATVAATRVGRRRPAAAT